MTTEPAHVADDLEETVRRARQRADDAGELVTEGTFPASGDLTDDVRDFILTIVRDGSYAEAVAELGRHEPDLATQ